jgi:hypothetical protein
MVLSGVAMNAPGCTSVRLAKMPGTAGAVGLGTAAKGFPVNAEFGGNTDLAAAIAGW